MLSNKQVKRKSILYGRRRRGNKTYEDRNFIGMKVYLPRDLHTMLMAYRASKGIPITRLITIAVYNEMRRDKSFYLRLQPETEFKAGKYTNEATVLMRFLKENHGGMAKDLLILSRHLIGIDDEDAILHAITELKDLGLVEEVENLAGSLIPWVQLKHYKQESLNGLR